MSGQADIRKRFMKPPAKASPATPTKPEESQGGEKTPSYKTTSKCFASTPPGTSTNTQKDEFKTPVGKSSPAAGKRLKEEKESDDEEKERPSMKKPRSVEQKGVKDEFESDSVAPSSVTPKGARRGRGRGRGGLSAKATEDEDEDVDELSVKVAGSGGGRGRGRGRRGKSDLSALSTSDVDDPEPSPKKPVAGRGRGRGQDNGGADLQADVKPAAAPAGRGRGGGGWGGGSGFGAREAPPHKGEKEIPRGAADALAGLTFVISGTLDSLEREEAEDLIKSHGGRITGSVSRKTEDLEEQVADIPFELLQQARSSGKLPQINKSKEIQDMKRANKNRPMEMSSKKPVGRFREVIQAPKREVRDPRFESLCGTFDESRYKKLYSFLYDEDLPAERQRLVKAVGKGNGGEDVEESQKQLKWIDKQLQEEEQRRKREKAVTTRVSKEKEAVKQGKKPYYPKKSEIRKEELVEKYQELKASGKLEKFVAKRRQKNATKDHRYVPYRRPEA